MTVGAVVLVVVAVGHAEGDAAEGPKDAGDDDAGCPLLN